MFLCRFCRVVVIICVSQLLNKSLLQLISLRIVLNCMSIRKLYRDFVFFYGFICVMDIFTCSLVLFYLSVCWLSTWTNKRVHKHKG